MFCNIPVENAMRIIATNNDAIINVLMTDFASLKRRTIKMAKTTIPIIVETVFISLHRPKHLQIYGLFHRTVPDC